MRGWRKLRRVSDSRFTVTSRSPHTLREEKQSRRKKNRRGKKENNKYHDSAQVSVSQHPFYLPLLHVSLCACMCVRVCVCACELVPAVVKMHVNSSATVWPVIQVTLLHRLKILMHAHDTRTHTHTHAHTRTHTHTHAHAHTHTHTQGEGGRSGRGMSGND